jgi:hypothetical protein
MNIKSVAFVTTGGFAFAQIGYRNNNSYFVDAWSDHHQSPPPGG